MRTKFTLLVAILLSLPVWADPSFDNLSQDDFKAIVRDFSSLTDFTSVSPASGLETWGFEVGVVGGVSQSHDVQSLVNRSGGSANVDVLPKLSLLGRLTLPHAITVEVLGLPRLKISGVATSQIGAAVQWTLTDELWLNRLVDIALKFKYSRTQTSFSQIIQNASTGNTPVNSTLELTDSVYGVNVFISHGFEVVEPYFSVGYLFGRGDLAIRASNNATVFNFTSAQSARAEPNSWQGIAGLNFFPFPFFVLGAEYTRAFDTNAFITKLSLQFE